MNWLNKKRIIVIAVVFSSMLIIVGWGKKTVDLLGSNYIDLDKAIQAAEWGTDDSDTPKTDVKEEKTDTTVTPVEKKEEKVVTIVISVSIRGEKITVDNVECPLDQLSDRIKAAYTGKEKVLLIDDFAKAQTYHDADAILSGLSENLGFEYEAQ